MKKIFKNTISALLCAGMILSSSAAVFAQNDADNATETEVADIYADFPVQIDKTVRGKMVMDMSFRYTNSLTDDNSATLTIKDYNTGDIVKTFEYTLEDNKAVFENVPNGKLYELTIDENVNGEYNSYTSYLETKYIDADFPVSMSLNGIDIEGDDNVDVNYMLIKKIADDPICTHGDDEDCTEDCEIPVTVIDDSERDTFYSDLESDNYYELQADVSDNGVETRFQGYISTYPDGENNGIFTRGYDLRKIATVKRAPQRAAAAYTPDFSEAVDYQIYDGCYINDVDAKDYVFRFLPPETGNYRFETLGNMQSALVIYEKRNGSITQSGRQVEGGGVGQNASSERGYLVDENNKPELYIYVKTAYGAESAHCMFRIVPVVYNNLDDVANNFYEVQTDLDKGIQSPAVNMDKRIDYNGDIDYYGYDSSNGYGYINFTSDEGNLKTYVYTVSVLGTAEKSARAPFDTLWQEDVLSPYKTTHVIPADKKFTKKRYYFAVRQLAADLPTYGGNDGYYDWNYFEYNFELYTPNHKDYLDAAGITTAPQTAVEVTDGYYKNSNLTLHRSDSDWFKVHTNSAGETIRVNLSNPLGCPYNIYLYKENDMSLSQSDSGANTWNIPDESLGDVTVEDEGLLQELVYSDTTANTDYIIQIGRPDVNTYDSYKTYTVEINVTAPQVPAAVLSGNVALSHTKGENITNTNDYKNTIMQKLTCSINGIAVSSSEAIADVELYYNDIPLTADTVNALNAGTYTIVPKYKNTAATGGTVTLTVKNPQSDNIVELTTVTNENLEDAAWDWVGAARMIANSRLRRENKAETTKDIFDALLEIKPDDPTVRGTLDETVNAAKYFYNDGVITGTNFIKGSVNLSTAENTLFNNIKAGKAVIMQLTSADAPTDMAQARYVVLCGVNKENHTLKIMDPVSSSSDGEWISKDTMFNGGYNGESSLKFAGTVIEFR